jgi:hypothetical protein
MQSPLILSVGQTISRTRSRIFRKFKDLTTRLFPSDTAMRAQRQRSRVDSHRVPSRMIKRSTETAARSAIIRVALRRVFAASSRCPVRMRPLDARVERVLSLFGGLPASRQRIVGMSSTCQGPPMPLAHGADPAFRRGTAESPQCIRGYLEQYDGAKIESIPAW